MGSLYSREYVDTVVEMSVTLAQSLPVEIASMEVLPDCAGFALGLRGGSQQALQTDRGVEIAYLLQQGEAAALRQALDEALSAPAMQTAA